MCVWLFASFPGLCVKLSVTFNLFETVVILVAFNLLVVIYLFWNVMIKR